MVSLRLALQSRAACKHTARYDYGVTDPSESQMSDSVPTLAPSPNVDASARSDVDVATPAAGGDAKRGKVIKGT